MLKADYCTLKVLTMRDNFIKAPTAERIKDALKSNRTMVKLSLDFNPIKQRCVEQIDEICRRNLALDEINTKNKNLELLALKKQTANTQKESLTSEICNLKQFTDKAVQEATDFLEVIEKKQKTRKSSQGHFQTVMLKLTNLAPSGTEASTSKDVSKDVSQQFLSSLPRDLQYEPQTAVTRVSNLTFSTSKVTHGRHKSQGPMRSEKVYHMTKIIQEKIQQLGDEQVTIKEQYRGIGERNDEIKLEIQQQYMMLKAEKEAADREMAQKEQELEELEQKQEEIRQSYLKMAEKIKDHTHAVKLGQQKAEEGIKEVRAELKQERRKYEGFLVRDHEKLGYARDMLQTRRLV